MTTKTKSAIIDMIHSRAKNTGNDWVHTSWIRGYIVKRDYFKAETENGESFEKIISEMIRDREIESDGKRIAISVEDNLDKMLDEISASLSFEQLKTINGMARGAIELPRSGRQLAEIVLKFYQTKPAPVAPTEKNGKIYASRLGIGESRTYSLTDKKRIKNSFHVLASTSGRQFTFSESKEAKTITVLRTL